MDSNLDKRNSRGVAIVHSPVSHIDQLQHLVISSLAEDLNSKGDDNNGR